MTSKELLKEIESWLSFNTEPSKEEVAKLRKSIKDHLAEQLPTHKVVGRSEQLTCPRCKSTNILNPDRDNDAQCIECAFIWAG